MKFSDVRDIQYGIAYGDWSKKIYKEDIFVTNNNITSLEGSPLEVIGTFDCRNNKLISLEHRPKKVSYDFYCSGNNLTSLEHRPKIIGGDFLCSYNKIINIKQEVIKNQVKAKNYVTDEGVFTFKEIKEEFEKYKNKLKEQTKKILKENKELKLKEEKELKEKKILITNKLNKIKNADFGLGF